MIEISLTNVLVAVIAVPIIFFVYFTLSVLKMKRKYSHIPGPEAKG